MTSVDREKRARAAAALWRVALVTGLAVGLVACGEGASTAPSGAAADGSPRATATQPRGASTAARSSDGAATAAAPAPQPQAPRSGTGREDIPRAPTQTTTNGTVIRPPATPAEDAVRAADACVRETLQDARGGTTAVVLPPPPGLQAEMEGDTVHVTIDTGQLPDACRPRFAKILIDDTDFAYPPFGVTVPLHGLGQQTISLRPASLPSRPAIVQASLGLRPELRGQESRVAIGS